MLFIIVMQIYERKSTTTAVHSQVPSALNTDGNVQVINRDIFS